VLGLQNHPDALRLRADHAVGDLLGQTFLNLQALAKPSTTRASFERPTMRPDGR
jgi:hypothetical protein